MFHADRFAEEKAVAAETLRLPFEARCRRRQHNLRLADGTEFGYHLPPGACLRGGDKLLAADGVSERVIAIVAAPEPLVEVRANDALRFAKAVFHLGNRHVAVEIGSDGQGLFLRMHPDHVLTAMLLGLGCSVEGLIAPFEPEGGAYGGNGHHHGTDHHHGQGGPGAPHEHGPKIHEFR